MTSFDAETDLKPIIFIIIISSNTHAEPCKLAYTRAAVTSHMHGSEFKRDTEINDAINPYQ